MLNMFSILYIFRAPYLVTINDENQINVYTHELCIFKETILVVKASEKILGISRICDMTRMIVTPISDYDGNKILVGGDDNDFISSFGFEIVKFDTEDRNIDLISLMGNNMIPTVIPIGEKHKYFIPDL